MKITNSRPLFRKHVWFALLTLLPLSATAGGYYLFQEDALELEDTPFEYAVLYENEASRVAVETGLAEQPWRTYFHISKYANPVSVVRYCQAGCESLGEIEKAERASADLEQIESSDGVIRVLPVCHYPGKSWRQVPTGRIIIRFSNPDGLDDVLRIPGIRLVRELTLADTFLLDCEAEVLSKVNMLHQRSDVAWAEPELLKPNRLHTRTEPPAAEAGEPLVKEREASSSPASAGVTSTPDDPYFDRAWHLNDPVVGLQAYRAWEIAWGDPNIVVSIFDDGIDAGHPDLNVSDAGKNWLVEPPSNETMPPRNAGHGTAAAGCVGAIGNNGIGVIGVAPGITLLPMKVTSFPNLFFVSNTMMGEAVRYAADHSDVGSMSLVIDASYYLRDVIAEVSQHGRNGKGFLFFCSSGNGGSSHLTYPSLYPYAISVGASDSQDEKWPRSNWAERGKTVDFLAPYNVWTTNQRQPSYVEFGGTSSAAPVAAGVAALILSAHPDLTRDQVLDIMYKSCDKLGEGAYDENGINRQWGHGRLNAFEALKRVPPYITEQPEDLSLEIGATDALQVDARGYQLTFQWQKRSSDGQTWTDLRGAEGRTYPIASAVVSDSGRYRVVVGNANGRDTSSSITVAVDEHTVPD